MINRIIYQIVKVITSLLVREGVGLLLLLALFMVACNGHKTHKGTDAGDTIPMHYARNLIMVQHDDYTEVFIRNPWDTTTVLHHYVLSSSDSPLAEGLKGATLVRVPLQRAGIFTAVHCGLVKELGRESAIRGICEIEYINIASIKKAVEEGRVANFGSAMEPTIEVIMDAQPDALLVSPFENSGGYGRVERLGIPIVECADYMEYSPLARAEWMRFYGRLFGVGERADSLFGEVEHHYTALRDSASHVSHRPTLIAEKPYGGVWYVPGGNSSMGVLYRDAGADYLFSHRKKNGSLHLSIESVFEVGQQADIWILKYNQQSPLTLQQLTADYPPFAHFRSVQSGRVYACNQETSRFYEETPYHPDRLLRNLVQIFHPELGIKAGKAYFQPLPLTLREGRK
ncbi:MAG: ABC transporter substrate-binding protein [Bacteroidaceae bacterium]|nr:ABC transporter substrate-binding protein [Bacteroidaceae bacterium]